MTILKIYSNDKQVQWLSGNCQLDLEADKLTDELHNILIKICIMQRYYTV